MLYSLSAEFSIQSNYLFFPKHISVLDRLIIHLFIMHVLSTYYVPGTVKYTEDNLINASLPVLEHLIVRESKESI